MSLKAPAQPARQQLWTWSVMHNYEVRLLSKDGRAVLTYITIGQSDAEVIARLHAPWGIGFVGYEIRRGLLLISSGPAR